MSLLGIHLTVLIGRKVPIPAPPPLLQAFDSLEVTHDDTGRSGFQMTFMVGRSGPKDLLEYALLSSPLLRVSNRVVLIVTFDAAPRVLMDGIITDQQLQPGSEPGSSTLTITGEDVSLMMDKEEKPLQHPAQDEYVIVNKIILSYYEYGLIPLVFPPGLIDPPIPIERTPVQRGTDLQYLNQMAKRHGYLFHIIPGPRKLVNTAYWGPPYRIGVPQKALSVNMGPDTNVESINFRHNSLAPTFVSGHVQDRLTDRAMPVTSFASMRIPLSRKPAWLADRRNVSLKQMRPCGLSTVQAYAQAQGETDSSMDDVVTATGKLDALRYGNLLKPRGLVGLRGVGDTYDGNYYVKSVTHNIGNDKYEQSFTITREGIGALIPVVIP